MIMPSRITARIAEQRWTVMLMGMIDAEQVRNGVGTMDKLLRDLKWFYDTLREGGKTAEFYESQAPIIEEVMKHIIFEQRTEILAIEYLSKCHCCDECFCECWCIYNNRRKGRVPHDGCKQNILDRLRDEV